MNVLEKDDVILSIAGSPIGNDGTIPFRDGGERISFRYAILSKFDGDSVAMQILRKGAILDIEVKVMKPGMLAAIPANQYDVIPSYFIFAGMVFQVLTQPYLSSEWGKEWQQKAPVRFVEKALYLFFILCIYLFVFASFISFTTKDMLPRISPTRRWWSCLKFLPLTSTLHTNNTYLTS